MLVMHKRKPLSYTPQGLAEAHQHAGAQPPESERALPCAAVLLFRVVLLLMLQGRKCLAQGRPELQPQTNLCVVQGSMHASVNRA